jgi:tripartite-type tricarboxylate transporter receptor subunit TctC
MKANYKLIFGTLIIFLSITILLSFARTAISAASYDAEKERAFFKGRVVIIIVPSKAGGWFDTWARLIQPFLRDRLSATVVLDNDPAAGRKRAMNRLMAGTPDGTLISIVNRANMITEMIEEEGVRYKMREFTWLGNTTNMARFFFVSQKSPLKNFQDFIKTTKKLLLGSTGVGAVNWYDALLLKKVFQKDNLSVVPGYEGSMDVYRAILQGEVDGTVAVENEVTNLPAEEVYILLQMGGPKGYLPNIKVPTFAEVAPPDAKDYVKLLDEQFYMARFWAGPPKMAPNRAKFLRDTFEEICKDPKFIASVNKAGARVDFTRGEKIEELVKSHMNQPARIIELFKGTEAK